MFLKPMISYSSRIYLKFWLFISNSDEIFFMLHKEDNKVKTLLSIFLFVYSKNYNEIKDFVLY